MGEGDAHIDQGIGLLGGALSGVGGSRGGPAEANSLGADHRRVRRVGGETEQLGQRLGPGGGLVDHEPQPGLVRGGGRGPSARATLLAQALWHLGELLGVLGAAPLDGLGVDGQGTPAARPAGRGLELARDRKSTRLNSSHVAISYAVFCLKKKTTSARCTYTCKISCSPLPADSTASL